MSSSIVLQDSIKVKMEINCLQWSNMLVPNTLHSDDALQVANLLFFEWRIVKNGGRKL